MDISANEFQVGVLKTESLPKQPLFARGDDDKALTRLLHAMLGVMSEAGEVADIVKRHLYYGQPLDLVHIAEELGDVGWYLAIGADSAGFKLGNVMSAVIAKLKVRYGEEFDMEKAAERARDRPAERDAMMASLFDGMGVE